MNFSKDFVFLSEFLDKFLFNCNCLEEDELFPAETMVSIYSRELKKTLNETVDWNYTISPKTFKVLKREREIFFVYMILRLCVIRSNGNSPALELVFSDFKARIPKNYFRNDSEYLLLLKLPDQFFCYRLDEILTPGFKSRRNFYRKYSNNSLITTKKITFSEFVSKYLRLRLIKSYQPTPKRLIRHKGYRDKGSLGKSRTSTEEIANDWFLEEERRKRKEKLEENIKLQLGLMGFL